PRWPVSKYHGLRRANYAHSNGPRCELPGRKEPAQEQGKGTAGAHGALVGNGRAKAARSSLGAAQNAHWLGRQIRTNPHLQLSAEQTYRPSHKSYALPPRPDC